VHVSPSTQLLDTDKDDALVVTNQDPTKQEGEDQEMKDGEVSYLVKGLLGIYHRAAFILLLLIPVARLTAWWL
jgi:hypothetical protein